jgi:hypothetical protein
MYNDKIVIVKSGRKLIIGVKELREKRHKNGPVFTKKSELM